MDGEQLKDRTKNFAVRIIQIIDLLPQKRSCEILGRQVLRSASSVGANYRAAVRARSKAEFVAKMHTVQEEGDETQYWIQLLHESGSIGDTDFQELQAEAKELTAIFTATEKTARMHMSESSRC
ncbi:MAG TPA: four helix bundle protein [Bacteroidota bacterium]|nr:four helix bundle protein [Bacteroidota bacterium]